MSELYIRKTEFLFADRKLDEDLTLYFDVPFDDRPEINIGEVEVYNLSDSTINALKKGDRAILNAGYQNDAGSILIGKIEGIETNWSGVDKITIIMVADANDDWMKKEIKRTYKEGTDGQKILNDLLPQTGLKVGALKLPHNIKYKNAKTFDGKLAKAIHEVATDCLAKIHINKDKIYIRPKNEGDDTGFVLNKDYGLIGTPSKIEKEEKQPDGTKKVKKGYKVISLLNYRIQTDALLKIESKTANGLFRVEKGKHVNGGNDFYTEMEVYPV